MTKITLGSISNPANLTSLQTTINANNAILTTAFDNTLSRDGTQPNQMGAQLDMNSNQIINLPAPATVNSPARLIDVASNPNILVPPTGSSGHTVPFLDGNNTWSGTNTYSAQSTFNGNVAFNGTVTGLSTVFPGWTNLTQASKTTNYTAINGDNGSTFSLSGNTLFSFSTATATTYTAGFVCVVSNADAYPGGRGKIISLNGLSSFILWPGQNITVFRRGNSWDYFPKFQRWAPGTNVTFFVDTAGSDSNDGLATGAGALRNIQTAVNLTQHYVDWGNSNVGLAGTIMPTAGQTFTESVSVSGAQIGSNEIFIQGNGGAFTWKNSGANSLLSVGDGGICIIQDIAFFSTNNTFGKASIYAHNNAIIDINSGISVIGGGTSDTAIFVDNHDCIVTLANGLTVSNTFGSIIWCDTGGHVSIGGIIAPSGATIVNSGLLRSRYRSSIIVGTQPQTTGWTSIAATLSEKGGMIDTNGTSIPGGATSATGGLLL